MRYKFVCENHDDYGTLGWRLESHPDFDPLQGMAVAHDCIEHFPDGDESPSDEFQALGAAFRIRGLGGFFNNVHTPESNIASDMPEIFQHIVNEDMGLSEPPKSAYSPMRDSEIETSLNTIVIEGLKLIKDQRQGYDDGIQASFVSEFRRKAVAWLRHGFRRAGSRYRNRLNEMVWMFETIQKESDKYLQDAEEGDKLTVQILLKSCSVDVQFKCLWR